MVRPEDELLILVPNRPVKSTAPPPASWLDAGRGLGIADVLAREGDGPAPPLRDPRVLRPTSRPGSTVRIGEGFRRRAVVRESFTATSARYHVLAEVAVTYRCNLTCGFCYAGCQWRGPPRGLERDRAMTDDEGLRVLDVVSPRRPAARASASPAASRHCALAFPFVRLREGSASKASACSLKLLSQ